MEWIRTLFIAGMLVMVQRIPVSASENWSMGPMRSRVGAAPGGHAAARFQVHNFGDTPVVLQFRIFDWDLGDQGSVRLAAPGSFRRGAAARAEMAAERLEVAPKKSAEVVCIIPLPADAAGSYHAAVEVSSADPPPAAGSGSRIHARTSLVHLITIDTLDRTDFAAELEEFAISRPDDTRSFELHGRLRNTGNGTLRPEGALTLVDDAGRIVFNQPLISRLTPPEAALEFRQSWDGILRPGRYRLLGTIELAPEKILTPVLEFEVVDRLELAGLHLRREEHGPAAELSIHNGGNLTHHPEGWLVVRDRAGETVASIPIEPITVLPNETATSRVPLDLVPEGEHIVTVELTSGPHRLTREIEVNVSR